MSTPAQGLDLLRGAAPEDLAALCERHGVDLLVVFGSTTDPEPVHPPADLDVAALLDTDRGDPASFVAELMAFTSCSAIDLLDLYRAGPVARARALGPGTIPLYERERGMFARLQMAALAHELDTRWMRDLGLELMAT